MSHSLCVRLSTDTTLLGIHEFIFFLPAPFPRSFRPPSKILSPSTFLPQLPAEAFDCRGQRMLPPRGGRQPMADGCCRAPGMPCREETCGAAPAIHWVAEKGCALDWSGAWSGVGQPTPWLDAVSRESGEGHINCISECRSLVFFKITPGRTTSVSTTACFLGASEPNPCLGFG